MTTRSRKRSQRCMLSFTMGSQLAQANALNQWNRDFF